jgi:iron-sulfur cluster repair protein YtfE (RIC family)
MFPAEARCASADSQKIMRNSHLSSTSTIDEIVAHAPIAISVFNAFGIDTCCGGAVALGDAALQAHVQLATLLAALDAASGDATGSVLGAVT